MKNIKISLLVFLVVIIFSNCNKSQDNDNDELASISVPLINDTTPITVYENTKFKFDFALANIPSPVGMMNDVSRWGESYDNTFFNDTKKLKNYSTEFSKALNLGVYNIDMSYAMVKNQGDDVLKYLKTVLVLSEGLGLKSALNQMVGKRAENNLGNKDSLLRILDEIFVKSDSYLRNNERVFASTAVFAGSWMESLFLSCKTGEATVDRVVKEKAYALLWEQRFHLGNLIAVLDDFSDNKDAVELNKQFKLIHEEIMVIKNPKHLDDLMFHSIASKIFKLRNNYTNN